MALPPGAIFEAVTPDAGVVVYDVSHLLPTKKGRPQPARKPGARIVRCYVHKSGGEGGAGFAGLLACARYVAWCSASHKTLWCRGKWYGSGLNAHEILRPLAPPGLPVARWQRS